MDQHRFDADPDPDPNVLVDADSYPVWHQNDASPHVNPTPVLLMLENHIFLLLVTALTV